MAAPAPRFRAPPPPAALALVLLLAAAAACASAQPLEVVRLAPERFEHDTQASTGQTTGHWCVLFTNSSNEGSPAQQAAEEAWQQLAEDEDKTVVVAQVDVARVGGASLAARLGVARTPAALLLRDRGMFRMALPEAAGEDADKLAAHVAEFVAAGYRQQAAEAVPPEPSALTFLTEVAGMVKVEPNWMLWIGVALLALGTVLFLGFFAVGWWMLLPDRPQAGAAAAVAPAAGKPAGASSQEERPGDGGDSDGDDGGVAKASGESRPAATRATTRRRA